MVDEIAIESVVVVVVEGAESVGAFAVAWDLLTSSAGTTDGRSLINFCAARNGNKVDKQATLF